MNKYLNRLNEICDILDREDDERYRAALLEEASILADRNRECQEAWRAYR